MLSELPFAPTMEPKVIDYQFNYFAKVLGFVKKYSAITLLKAFWTAADFHGAGRKVLNVNAVIFN